MPTRRRASRLTVAVLAVLGVAVTALAVTGWMLTSAFAQAPAARTPIKIGVLAPLSGPLAALARDVVDGAKLYVDEINGEMAGRKVELVVEDYEFKAAVALTKAKKLVENDRVNVVCGVILSAAVLAIKDYIHAQEVSFIVSGAAVAEAITLEKPSPYVFRTTFSASQVPGPLAKFTYDKLKARTATVIAGDTVGTIELVMGFARAFEEAGGKVVQEPYPPIGTTDFGPYIGKIRRDVNVVATLVPGADGIRFIKQYEEFGLKGKIPVVDTAPGITDIAVLPSAGTAAVGMHASNAYIHTIKSRANQKFVQAFRAKTGRDPGGPGEYTYSALAAINQALQATKGNIEDKPKFLEALRKMDLEAPRGQIRFDKYQHVIEDVIITRIDKEGDKVVPVVVETFKAVDQFQGMAPEEYLKKPRLIALKGTFGK
jgi:branched-chain amino acid transport system substrate-binding protein